MEPIPFCLILSILLWISFHLLNTILRPWKAANLPPGPPPLPIVGNILQLIKNPHQSLAKLAKTYGPIMHLKLGTLDTIVISSPDLAKEVLQKHDKTLSSRPIQAISTTHNHHELSVLWLPANAQWRNLRRICKDHMFSPQRLNATRGLRRNKVDKLRDYVHESCEKGNVVDIGDAVFTMSVNLITGSLFSMDFAEFHLDSSQELKGLIRGIMRLAGTANLADFFPVLKPVDPQRLEQQTRLYADKIFAIFDDVIEKRLKLDSAASNDLLGSLLEISKENESAFTRNDILHLLLDLFVAGIDTIATTIEWAMAELIRNPKEMAKARNEIHKVVGINQQVQESDIPNLPYLQAIIKENFRLHPSGPLLTPHKAEADTEISGFLIPKNAQVLINIWAIGRDPRTWSDPDCFSPERFLGSNIDFKGHNFELIPFGSGRRMCPAMPMAHPVVQLTVASLIQSFDWRLERGSEAEDLNMDEKYGFTLLRVAPLKATPIKI